MSDFCKQCSEDLFGPDILNGMSGITDDVIVQVAIQHNKHTEPVLKPITYNEAVIAVLFPELIRRLQNNKSLKEAVEKFLKQSSWDRYSLEAETIEIKGKGIKHTVCCGVIPFIELEQALKSSKP